MSQGQTIVRHTTDYNRSITLGLYALSIVGAGLQRFSCSWLPDYHATRHFLMSLENDRIPDQNAVVQYSSQPDTCCIVCRYSNAVGWNLLFPNFSVKLVFRRNGGRIVPEFDEANETWLWGEFVKLKARTTLHVAGTHVSQRKSMKAGKRHNFFGISAVKLS